MISFLRSHPIELALMGFYVVLAVKSAVYRDWPRAMYWLGALILMVGVLWGMVK